MFAYLKGILTKKTLSGLVIEVNGIGYMVYTSDLTISSAPEIGSQLKLYTYFYVREDNQSLYGFMTEEELKMFERLLTVSGVGPKAALSLLSNLSPSQFALAVLTDHVDAFTKAPGIGKKTAQRIILELKDKLKKENKDMPDYQDLSINTPDTGNKMNEAVTALIMLGYTTSEANKAIASVYDDNKPVEQIIKDALKHQAPM
ncbi:MAG: Holliday junction branch migration protein RuvA [Acetivibrionales bacterium]|nr:Holliday junction branch migration protein RuvA [Clostridiaceae bacterium]